MRSLIGVNHPLPKQWLQSGLLHGGLLLCAVLYHLHSQGSLHPSTNNMSQTDASTTASLSHNSIDFLDLSFEQYALAEPRQVDSKPAELVVEEVIDDARDVSSEVPRDVPIEVSKVEPIAVKKVPRSVAKKSTTTEVLTTNSIQPAAVIHRVAAQPRQAARPDHAYSPKPAYPLALRDLGVSGVVWLRVWVDDTGHPREIELSKGSGYRLFDEAALRAVQHWRFIPAKNEQKSLASWVEFAVRFEING